MFSSLFLKPLTTFSSRNMSQGCLFGMGNILLDVLTVVEDSFLQRYKLKPNDAILCDETNVKMFADIVKECKDITYMPGGATLNSVKVAQWLLPSGSTTFFGCIGKDKFGEIIQEKLAECNVRGVYQFNDTEATGTAACLINGEGNKNRSLAANLAAANKFTIEHVDNADNWALVEKARVAYVGGFFLTVCPPAALKVAKHCSSTPAASIKSFDMSMPTPETGKLFVTNISAPFIAQVFIDPLRSLLPFTDILFGNDSEAQVLAESLGLDVPKDDVRAIAEKIAALPKENSRPRMVVFTQGTDPVIVAHDGTVDEIAVPVLEASKVADPTGAGDAFVGGFLSRLCLGKPVTDCVKCGFYAAQVVIQHVGCTFPKEHEYKD